MRNFCFLFTIEESNPDLADGFLQEIRRVLRVLDPTMRLFLYTSANYRETILINKCQRYYLTCSTGAIPIVEDLLKNYHANELPVTLLSSVNMFFILGTPSGKTVAA